mmetsp:Transcript_1824/g.6890  ORF Transcript_1824/g.6890 Transcript_1824/m.6890 type:complete len:351 (+) Transcript_1824:672-1724(+)
MDGNPCAAALKTRIAAIRTSAGDAGCNVSLPTKNGSRSATCVINPAFPELNTANTACFAASTATTFCFESIREFSLPERTSASSSGRSASGRVAASRPRHSAKTTRAPSSVSVSARRRKPAIMACASLSVRGGQDFLRSVPSSSGKKESTSPADSINTRVARRNAYRLRCESALASSAPSPSNPPRVTARNRSRYKAPAQNPPRAYAAAEVKPSPDREAWWASNAARTAFSNVSLNSSGDTTVSSASSPTFPSSPRQYIASFCRVGLEVPSARKSSTRVLLVLAMAPALAARHADATHSPTATPTSREFAVPEASAFENSASLTSACDAPSSCASTRSPKNERNAWRRDC